MKSLVLDNYDSFSHILWQYLWEVNGEEPLFIRNDEWTLDQILAARFDNLVISPGPGHPGAVRDFGICGEAIRACAGKPVLGVCLGLQGLGLEAGARVGAAPVVRHGKHSPIRHDGQGLFAGLPQGFAAVRYHSLVIDPATAPPGLIITATAGDDGQIMGVRLAERPAYGVQFHPESIGTEHGKALLANFRNLSAAWIADRAGMPVAAGPNPVAHDPGSLSPTPLAPAPTAPTLVLEARELPWADPEAAFDRFFRKSPASFWLDSLAEPVAGEPRVTYMGSGNRLLEAKAGRVRVRFAAEAAGSGSGSLGDPFDFLESALGPKVTCKLPEGMAFAGSFLGGLVGWFGYGLKRYAGGGDTAGPIDPDLPDALFLEPDRLMAFDPAARKAYAILPALPGRAANPDDQAWLDEVALDWAGLASKPLELHRDPGPDADPADPLAASRLPITLSLPKAEYLDRIRTLQQAIARGETYEACLTNEARVRIDADPFEVYRLLRRTNPSPYAAFLNFPDAQVLCASPERFLKLDAGGKLACRPIKGTRPRGSDATADEALQADLAVNPKDHSENLMIVDLVRNDFARVCEPFSVAVPEMMRVEAHPSVWQLVSTVTGRLAAGRGAMDAVRACFPGGSMTGAPKKRTMELLEAAEGRPRGIFSGALGYLGRDGAMDLGMVIRTLVHLKGEFRIGCGGAILAESDPEAEFAEAMLKAAAPLRALELAAFGRAGTWKTGSR